jgi:hypothetical protein
VGDGDIELPPRAGGDMSARIDGRASAECSGVRDEDDSPKEGTAGTPAVRVLVVVLWGGAAAAAAVLFGTDGRIGRPSNVGRDERMYVSSPSGSTEVDATGVVPVWVVEIGILERLRDVGCRV